MLNFQGNQPSFSPPREMIDNGDAMPSSPQIRELAPSLTSYTVEVHKLLSGFGGEISDAGKQGN